MCLTVKNDWCDEGNGGSLLYAVQRGLQSVAAHVWEEQTCSHLVEVRICGQLNHSTTRNHGLPEPSRNMDNYKAAAKNVRGRQKKD